NSGYRRKEPYRCPGRLDRSTRWFHAVQAVENGGSVNRVQTVFRMFMLVAIVGLIGGVMPVAAQSLDRSDDTWVSELTGVEITFSSDWELADERVSPDGENELIFLETRDGFLMIGFGSTDDVENTIASTIGDIDGAEQVDGAVEPD